MVKSPKHVSDQYSFPHEPPLLSAVKEAFISDCNALQDPEESRESVMYRVLCNHALKHFRIHIVNDAKTAEMAFYMLHRHYNTLAHQRNNKDGWNSLTFKFLSAINPGKFKPEILQILYHRAQDLQTLLGPPYTSDLLLCESVYAPFARHLKGEDAEREPQRLYTQILNAINVQNVKWRDLNS